MSSAILFQGRRDSRAATFVQVALWKAKQALSFLGSSGQLSIQSEPVGHSVSPVGGTRHHDGLTFAPASRSILSTIHIYPLIAWPHGAEIHTLSGERFRGNSHWWVEQSYSLIPCSLRESRAKGCLLRGRIRNPALGSADA